MTSCHMSRDIVWLSGGGDEGDFRSVNYRISTLFQVRRSVSKWDLPYQSGCVYAYIYTLVFSSDACSKPCSAQSPLLDSFRTMALQSRCIYPRTHPCSRGSQCIDVPPVLFWLRGPLDVDCDKNNSSWLTTRFVVWCRYHCCPAALSAWRYSYHYWFPTLSTNSWKSW